MPIIKIYIVKRSISPRAVIFNALPIIIPEIVSTDQSSKFRWNFKNLSKNSAGETMVPYLMLCSHSNDTTMIQHKSRCRNRREDDPEMNPYGYSHLVFDKSVKKKKMHRRKDSNFRKLDSIHRMKLNPHLLPWKKFSIMWSLKVWRCQRKNG